MESISIIKGPTNVKKEAEKYQRQKSFFLIKYNMLLFSALTVFDTEIREATPELICL